MNRLAYLAFALALTPCLGLADDAEPAAAAGAQVDSYAPSTCKKPEVKVGMGQSHDSDRAQAKYQAYKDCMNAYIATQTDLAQKHRLAGNAAVAEYNAFVNEMNAAIQQNNN